MTEHRPSIRSSASTKREILALVASGRSRTRTDLGRSLNAPASTVSMAVQALLDGGLLVEAGTVPSTGGRPQKRLALAARAAYVLAADVGGSHARIGMLTASDEIADLHDIEFDTMEGPEQGIARLVTAFESLIDRYGSAGLVGIGIALPGPVNTASGMLDSPSRMPGWHNYPVRDAIEDVFRVPVLVDNDANLMAYGEYTAHPEHRTSITVKAGTAIGAGFVVEGNLYRGAGGAAGDITHVRVAAAGSHPCTCGNVGCLETVASGAALVRILSEAGVAVRSSADIVALAQQGDPTVTNAVRLAGRHLGEVLAAIVNFTTPDAVFLGGAFSAVEPFVAAVRGQLYDSCHPLATRRIVIEATDTSRDAGVVGAGHLAMKEAMSRSLDSLDAMAG
jgi:predicted NBD/HSP70 family sugar kinase